MRRKRAASFRDKSWKEIGFARSHQFLHLFFWNGAMQNRFADAKCAFFGGCGGALADKGILELINLSFLTIGQTPIDSCWDVSIFCSAPFPSVPKSNSGLKSSPNFTAALNGRPILLRNPSSGATRPSARSFSTCGLSNSRPAIVLQTIKPPDRPLTV